MIVVMQQLVVQVITQTCEFDLALTKVLTSAGPFGPGSEVTYAINVINQGTIDATAITIVDYTPAGMMNNDPDWSGNTLSVGALAAGDMTTVELTLTIDSDFTGGELVNFAEIKDASNALGLKMILILLQTWIILMMLVDSLILLLTMKSMEMVLVRQVMTTQRVMKMIMIQLL